MHSEVFGEPCVWKDLRALYDLYTNIITASLLSFSKRKIKYTNFLNQSKQPWRMNIFQLGGKAGSTYPLKKKPHQLMGTEHVSLWNSETIN